MVSVRDILNPIEEFAPLDLQENYDNAGLICGDPAADVSSVLLTTDITEEVIDEAIADNHQLIISHHPLSLQGFKNLVADTPAKRCLVKAIRHGLNIYSAHTNIDAVANGVSGRMAAKLGLQDCRVLQPSGRLFSLVFYTPATSVRQVRDAVLDAGGGHIGKYDRCSFNTPGQGMFQAGDGAHPYVGLPGILHTEEEIRTEITVPEHLLRRCTQALVAAHPYEEPVWNAVCLNNTNPSAGFGIIGELLEPCDSRAFLEQVKETFRCQTIRHTSLCMDKVKKIAVCGGSGAFLTQNALAAGADVYLTGDYKYHDFFQAESRIIIADIGHYESEQFTKEIFYELVTKKISKFAVQFSKIVTNPINYL